MLSGTTFFIIFN